VSSTDKYRLGRACTFAVNGVVLTGVRDVAVRRTTNEVDATGYGHSMQSSVVIHRTYEIDVEVLDVSDADILHAAASFNSAVTITTTLGLLPLSTVFTVHETTADESLDDAVVATFTLRQWGHGL
jgi:hypothetical protein